MAGSGHLPPNCCQFSSYTALKWGALRKVLKVGNEIILLVLTGSARGSMGKSRKMLV